MLINIREILHSDMRLLINEIRFLIRNSQDKHIDNNLLKDISSKLNILQVILISELHVNNKKISNKTLT